MPNCIGRGAPLRSRHRVGAPFPNDLRNPHILGATRFAGVGFLTWNEWSRPVSCAFCDWLADGEFVAANDLAAAFLDAFPLNPGHCLIVPRRHESDFLALTENEQSAIWGLLPAVRRHVESRGIPDGYNIGINVGEAAGQTIAHAHVHVIPRFHSDVSDPRGGVRWVVPAKARYWEPRD